MRAGRMAFRRSCSPCDRFTPSLSRAMLTRRDGSPCGIKPISICLLLGARDRFTIFSLGTAGYRPDQRRAFPPASLLTDLEWRVRDGQSRAYACRARQVSNGDRGVALHGIIEFRFRHICHADRRLLLAFGQASVARGPRASLGDVGRRPSHVYFWVQRGGPLRYVEPTRSTPSHHRLARGIGRQKPGQSSQAKRGPKNPGRSIGGLFSSHTTKWTN